MKTKSKNQKRSQGGELTRSEDLTVRTYALKLNTLDEKTRSIEAVIATEDPVVVMDLRRWEPVEEILLMSGCILPKTGQVVLLDTHDRSTVEKIFGSTRDLRVVDGQLIGRNYFSRKAGAEDAFGDVKDGHLTDYSIGYKVHEYEMIEPGETKIIQGRPFTAGKQRARRISTRWEAKENSVCSIAADPNAKNRNNNLEFQMKTKQNTQQTEKTALDLEQERVDKIRSLAGDRISQGVVDECIREGLSVEDSQSKMLADMRSRTGNSQTGSPALPSVSVGDDLNRESLPVAIADAICTRAGARLVKEDSRGNVVLDNQGNIEYREPHGRSRSFMEMRLADMARTVLSQSGFDKAMSLSDRQAVKEALSTRAGLSTLSLPNILGNSLGQSLRSSYHEYPAQWVKFCKRASANSFKDITRSQLHELDHLGNVLEGGEYPYTTIGESSEVYKLLKHGEIIGVTWESLVNDNLDAFREIPLKLAQAARRKEDVLAFGILTANAAMADTVALFHSTHANLGLAAAISVAALDAGRLSFRKQTSKAGGDDTAYVVMDPKVLITPCALEGSARKLLKSEFDPDDDAGKTANIWEGELNFCCHPILDGASASNWYMSGGPDQAGIEMCFLDNQAAPFVDHENDFEMDAVRYKVRHVCAAAAVDHRALYKNPYAG